MQRNFLSHTTNASARIDCLSKFKRRKSYFPKIHGGSKTNQSIPTNDFLVSINQAVYKELSYNLRMEVGVQHQKKLYVSRVDLAEILHGY
jgi:hypothetical protein